MESTPDIQELRVEYQNKIAILMSECGQAVKPRAFYRAIFPEGFLQDAYRVNPAAPHNGDFVAIANVVYERPDGSGLYRRNRYVTDDLSQVTKWPNQVAFMSPCAYLGGAKDLEHLRYVNAFVVDLDYVGPSQVQDLFHQCQIGFLPRPTFIVNSGTGLHLYYVLSAPLKVYENQYPALNAFKHALIDLCWNEYTSRSLDRQYSGLVQPYRIPGTRTKLDIDHESQKVVSTDYPVIAFRYGDKWKLDSLLAWKPMPEVGTMHYRERCAQVYLDLHPEENPDRLTLEKAKEKYPEWYDERVVLGIPARDVSEYKWHVSPRVYEWWLRRIREEARPGHRYHCIMILAVYAIKCDVSWEKLKRDAYGLFDLLEARTDDPINHFHKSDIAQALHAYRKKGYATLPLGSIEYFSGLRIERNRRNGRDQATHLARARAVQAIDDPDGSWRNKRGAPTKRDEVLEYASGHPEANHSEIARALGISRPTVIKWLKARSNSQI